MQPSSTNDRYRLPLNLISKRGSHRIRPALTPTNRSPNARDQNYCDPPKHWLSWHSSSPATSAMHLARPPRHRYPRATSTAMAKRAREMHSTRALCTSKH